ncbi:MAG TPA: tyrosinase family protein [Actinomycetota bacterium]|nr:tyrosinase family protein [Actinomycetota bacterium]
MASGTGLRVRRSITELQEEYRNGNTKPLDDLMRAWKGIKELDPADPRSFFSLGGLHGEPFRGAGWGTSAYWGGYCNHGNVLFPTWHRMYLATLEDALRSIPGCSDVTLPFWDETSDESVGNGIPWALTQETFVLDGATIANPLRSFVFTQKITDFINGDNPNYSKPKGYETVRYPLSGLVGTAEDRANTAKHNAQYPNYATNVGLLNQNIVNWLGQQIIVDNKPVPTNIRMKLVRCLEAPNYTLFSNTTSCAQYNADRPPGTWVMVPLESPHNDMHLAVGGFDVAGQGDFSPLAGANGDMGENDTAGLDPIFYFHHCFIDRMFWLWQQRHGSTERLEIIEGYPGTNSVDSQGPTPGIPPNSWLSLDTPLNPFKTRDGRVATSRDCINIETQLGYRYGPGSLGDLAAPSVAAATGPGQAGRSAKAVRVTGLNRAAIRGSFLISAFATIGGTRYHVGSESVLSRWSVQGCANCQTHLEVKAYIGLHDFDEETLAGAAFDVEVRTRDGVLTQTKSVLPTFHRKAFAVDLV